MAQPTDPLIIWATNNITLPVSGQQNKVKPQSSLIETGWDKTQKPTCEEFNSVLNNFALWIDYYGTEKILDYLRKDQNLADLSNNATARTNLDVFSKSETNSKQINTGAGIQGGGDLSANRTISMAPPSTVGNGSTNSATNGGSPTHTHSLDVTGNISVLTGVVLDGGTIPLPVGYTETQCKWLVSINNDNNADRPWDIDENVTVIQYKQECRCVGRVVTVRSYAHPVGWTAGSANYIIIGVK